MNSLGLEAGRPINVLIIEDSEDDARLAMRVLRKGGFAPTFRRVQDLSGIQAAFKEESWDAVLSDFRLPGFNGVDALRAFREFGLDIPFIFFSGTIGEEVAVEAMKAGANDYVMKQNIARLAPAIDRELAQAAIRAQHRQGQIDLKLSCERYVDLYDFAPVGYLSLSCDTGLIEQANLTAADMLASGRDVLAGAAFTRFVQPEQTEHWRQHFAHAVRHGGKHRLELVLSNSRGTSFCTQIDCLRTGSSVRVALTDISDCKRAESDLRQFEAQLRDIQKMESLGTLAGGIAHDFNNILGAILGNVVLARDEAGPNQTSLHNSLNEIHKAGLRARNLVQQILTFSRREKQPLITQPLRPMLEETRRLLRATLPARVELEMSLARLPLHVHMDATQMQQVLMNLCTNAWHALPEQGGRIGMGIEEIELDDAAARRFGGVLSSGRHAHLWVSDNGCGMDAVTRERIFEPFFTTKPVGQGTGLGLSVVHGILTAHCGAITVDTRPGHGSVFHLYLPVAPQSESLTPPLPLPIGDSALPAPQGQGQHILYVDDDAMMVLMVERLLERSGYQVTVFLDARAAVAAVRQRPGEFDLIVTDFNMPEFSGLDVAHELARIRPELPVVISSGYITDAMRSEARLAGVRGLIEKQNTFHDLPVLLGQLLLPQQFSSSLAPGH